jgi:hypothetical protein
MLLRHQRVKERAAEIVGHRQADARVAQSVLRSYERHRVELEAEIHAVNLARERLARFQPEIGGSLQCPRCWIENEIRSPLTRIRGTDRYELFGCPRCELELAVPPVKE